MAPANALGIYSLPARQHIHEFVNLFSLLIEYDQLAEVSGNDLLSTIPKKLDEL